MSWSLDVNDGVALMQFTAPPRNIARYSDLEDLEARLAEAEAAGARVAVLTGGLPGWFIAHADLDDLLALREGRPTSGDGSAWGRVLRALDKGPMVSIAAVNGQAWGGGCELALTCNLRWMSTDATIGFPEVALGILPGVGAHRAVRLLPEHLALELLATGTPLDAARAEALGLVNGTMPPERLLPYVLGIADAIAQRPPAAVAALKELVIAHRDAPTRDMQRRQLELFMDLLRSEDAGRLLSDATKRYADGAEPGEAFGVAPAAASNRAVDDKQALGELLARYCRGIDRCDEQLVRSVYHADAVDDHGWFQGSGWEFAAWVVPRIEAAYNITQHTITKMLVDIDGDVASGETYVTAYHVAEDDGGVRRLEVFGGRYVDRFERRDGAWRIARRLVVHDWSRVEPLAHQLPGRIVSARERGATPIPSPSS